jgi:Zn-dependent M28 family amino/carboxypeptidase
VHARPIPDVELEAQVEVEVEKREGHNVIGVLRALPPREAGAARLPVVIGAHYDHLGNGGSHTTSRARPDEEGRIHPGADDNASGVAALLELAQYLSARRADRSLKLERDIIFGAWSGEESGLIGSRYFVGEPSDRPFAAYINMDMVGRFRGSLALWGMGTSSAWETLVEQARSKTAAPVPVVPKPLPSLPTDTVHFYCARVPVLTAYTGGHSQYHTPRDTADSLSYDGLARITEFVAELAQALAADPDVIPFIDVDPPESVRCRSRTPNAPRPNLFHPTPPPRSTRPSRRHS